MCGIAGIVDFAGRSLEPSVLESACESMRHRGPDDSGSWIARSSDHRAGFAATRLAILDPTPAGRQPMTSEDGRFVMVFNGLIYNHRELRDELSTQGTPDSSESELKHGKTPVVS